MSYSQATLPLIRTTACPAPPLNALELSIAQLLGEMDYCLPLIHVHSTAQVAMRVAGLCRIWSSERRLRLDEHYACLMERESTSRPAAEVFLADIPGTSWATSALPELTAAETSILLDGFGKGLDSPCYRAQLPSEELLAGSIKTVLSVSSPADIVESSSILRADARALWYFFESSD
jgi:hypothetical protein